MDNKSTNWIWLKTWEAWETEEPVLALFRKSIDISGEPIDANLRISADSRYKLYINGVLVEVGPSKGDKQVWFFDEINLLPYLSEGENVFAVQVLRYPTIHSKGCHGIFRTEYPGLFVEGKITDSEGNQYLLDADSGWKGKKDAHFRIVSESEIFAPLQILENTAGDIRLKGWMNPGYDESDWEEAFLYPDMSRAVSPGNLLKRTIPYLYRKEQRFERVVQTEDDLFSEAEWEALIAGKKRLMIPPYKKVQVEFSAGVERTGYLHLTMQEGADAKISILTSEAYVLGGERGDLKVPLKGDRTDYENGFLHGFTDYYQCAGFGTEEEPEKYEPFWFRTFRFVRLEIETEESPLTLSGFDYTQTGYPLEVKTKASASDERFAGIWDISERSLRCCMHETYEDCPFYEQLQYAMDSRTQILYTYTTAADDRLARKCMDDFKRSQRYDGLLNGSYPCYGANVIPGFSIYYILMLYDHMMYFGDRELLKEHMPTVEGILNFFHRNLSKEGYVKKIGGLNGKDKFWSFIDWAAEWEETTGIPPAISKGSITMESLLYVMGLQYAADIACYLERDELADHFLNRADAVQKAIRVYCTGKNGMIQDGPGIEEYSQHTQVFAALTETVTGERAAENLKETILNKEHYPQCSVAMAFYLFRALQKTGLYEFTKDCWNIWQKMIEKHATTCVEDDVQERSECHAWGALILYELPAVILGVRPVKPGYEAVEIHPEAGYLEHAEGEVITPKGSVYVKWEKDETGMHVKYELPEEMVIR